MKKTAIIFGLGIVAGRYVQPVLDWLVTDGRSVTWLLLIGIAVVVTWQARGIHKDREWGADVRKRAAWCLKAPHLYAGAPIYLSRENPDIAIYRERRFFSGDYITEEGYRSTETEVPLAA